MVTVFCLTANYLESLGWLSWRLKFLLRTLKCSPISRDRRRHIQKVTSAFSLKKHYSLRNNQKNAIKITVLPFFCLNLELKYSLQAVTPSENPTKKGISPLLFDAILAFRSTLYPLIFGSVNAFSVLAFCLLCVWIWDFRLCFWKNKNWQKNKGFCGPAKYYTQTPCLDPFKNLKPVYTTGKLGSSPSRKGSVPHISVRVNYAYRVFWDVSGRTRVFLGLGP